MKSTGMDPSRRPIVIIAALVVVVGLGLLYSFHRQNNQLLAEHQSLHSILQKCERAHKQCSSDVTICMSHTNTLRTTNGDTAKQLKQAQEEATAAQNELQVFKRTGTDMKRELEAARKDLVTRESTLVDTGTKLSEAETFSKMVIAAVDSNVDQSKLSQQLVNSTVDKINAMKTDIETAKKDLVTRESTLVDTGTKLSEAETFSKMVIAAVDGNIDQSKLSQQLVNSTVDKINAMKTEIETLKRKIAEIVAKPTRSAPKATAAPVKPADVKPTAAPKAAATEASATEAATESVTT